MSSSAHARSENAGEASSWLRAWREWRLRRRVDGLLRRGRAKQALQWLDGWDGDEPERRMRALAAVGKPGAARREMQSALAGMEARLARILEPAEAALLAAAGEEQALPVHLLKRLPRHQPGVFEVEGTRVRFPDGPSAASAWQEIFVKRMYEIPAAEAPRIIDGGANIGLAALFFKKRHPRARVTCFEADPKVAGFLRANLEAAGAGDVEVVEAALWGEDGALSFAAEGSDAGRADAGGNLEVKAARLSPYLDEPVDLLKLDIEGAEGPVLRECRESLGQVRRIFVEYHSFEGQPQDLDELLGILKVAGFRVSVTVSDTLTWRPFVEKGSSLGMDMRLNVFGFRE